MGGHGSPAGGGGNGALKDFLMGPPAGATMAGALEILVFHPADTIAKRLMSHTSRVVIPNDVRQTAANCKAVMFRGISEERKRTVGGHVAHLYPGSKWAVTYKVSQRVIKFAGQPMLRDYMYRTGSDRTFTDALGPKWGKMCLEASAGTVVGMFEVVLLPFDRMKVLSQTNKDAVANRSFIDIVRREGISAMYAGAATTAMRNMPGSFLLFWGTCMTKDFVFGLEDYRSATFFQNTASSTVGACMGVAFTSPMDVVKTRIQSQSFGQRRGGLAVVGEVIRTEGISAFYKGLTPKLITSAPKLVFTYTLTEFFVGRIREWRVMDPVGMP
jgi:hypothetical protein